MLRQPIRLRDVLIRQTFAYPRPCDQKLGFAVVKVNAVAAVGVERWLIVHVAAPPPARCAEFHDPAYRYTPPDHGEVVNAGAATELGDVEGNGFGTGHSGNLARNA